MYSTDVTTYQELYDSLLSKIKSYDFVSLPDYEVYQIIYDYIRPAIVKYTNCKKDLSDRDNILEQFNFKLTDTELEVLVKYMLVEWLEANYINTPMVLKSQLTSKEFNATRNVEVLDKVIMLRNKYLQENKQLAGINSYKDSELFNII